MRKVIWAIRAQDYSVTRRVGLCVYVIDLFVYMLKCEDAKHFTVTNPDTDLENTTELFPGYRLVHLYMFIA